MCQGLIFKKYLQIEHSERYIEWVDGNLFPKPKGPLGYRERIRMKTTLSLDARKRVTLPSALGMKPGDDVELEVLDDGRIFLTPIVRIPRHQMWAWTERVDRLLAEAAADKSPKVRVTTDSGLEDLISSYNSMN